LPRPLLQSSRWAPAAPAVAKANAPLAAPTEAKTPLVAKIAKDTSIIHERLPDRLSDVYASLQQDANACRGYALFVGRMPADRAQPPAQLEWVKGHAQPSVTLPTKVVY
jgi:hypothetical protein